MVSCWALLFFCNSIQSVLPGWKFSTTAGLLFLYHGLSMSNTTGLFFQWRSIKWKTDKDTGMMKSSFWWCSANNHPDLVRETKGKVTYMCVSLCVSKTKWPLTTRFTKPPDCLPPAGKPSRDRSPIHNLRDFFHSTGIVPGKAGNGSASGFVNGAVKTRQDDTTKLDTTKTQRTQRCNKVNNN